MQNFITQIQNNEISRSKIVFQLHDMASKGLRQYPISEDILSIYESYLLWELGTRTDLLIIGSNYIPTGMFWDFLNLTLMSKLFDDNGLYEYYYNKTILLFNSNRERICSDYITQNLKRILDCDIDSLIMLNNYRHTKHKKTNQEYHFNYFPFKFDFEYELIKKIKTKSTYPNDKKNISSQVCDLIVATEIYIENFS